MAYKHKYVIGETYAFYNNSDALETTASFNYCGMAVPHMRPVATAVEISLPLLIKEMRSEPPDDLQRVFVGNAEVGSQVLASEREEFFLAPAPSCGKAHSGGTVRLCGPRVLAETAGGSLGGLGFRDGNSENEVGIRRECFPDLPLGRTANPGKVAFPAQGVGDDLEVEVRSPVAVARIGAHPGELSTLGDELARR